MASLTKRQQLDDVLAIVNVLNDDALKKIADGIRAKLSMEEHRV